MVLNFYFFDYSWGVFMLIGHLYVFYELLTPFFFEVLAFIILICKSALLSILACLANTFI